MLKKLLFVSLASIILASSALAKNKKDEDVNSYELLNLFGEVMERAKATYVEEITDKQLIEAAINGMLVSLDPHSSYLDAKDFKYMTEQTSGKFGGLGIEITMEQGVVKIVSPIDDTPASRAGLKPGDYITNLDGESVVGMTLNDAVNKMTLDFSKKYEGYLGKDFMKVDKLDALIEIIDKKEAKTISEAIDVYKNRYKI